MPGARSNGDESPAVEGTGADPDRAGDHGTGGHPDTRSETGQDKEPSEQGHPGGHPTNTPSDGQTSSGHPGRAYDQAPRIVTWEVTQACALECDHCRADAQPDRDPRELTTEEGKALIDQVAGFGQPPPIFVFSGGDPLERPDIFELVEYATDAGLPTAITPAPTPRLDDQVLERFVELGVRRVALSLDGASPATHDTFRGEPGSFELIMDRARTANELGLSIQINTTITANTVDELPQIADLVEEMGAAMWEVFFLVPIGRGAELAQLEPDETVEVMEWLYDRQQEASFRIITVEAPHYRVVADRVQRRRTGSGVTVGTTRAGKGFVFVSHRGEVYPSGFLPLSAGNVREDDLVDCYRDTELFSRLRDADRFGGACGRCPHRELCGGSRSRAYAVWGTPFGSDPLCPFGDTEAL